VAHLERSAKKMKALLIAIGCLLAFGGAAAIHNHKEGMMFSTGPSLNARMPSVVRDEFSAERSQITGHVSFALGAVFVAAGLFWKKLSSGSSLDDR
jgi:hypothetical protein